MKTVTLIQFQCVMREKIKIRARIYREAKWLMEICQDIAKRMSEALSVGILTKSAYTDTLRYLNRNLTDISSISLDISLAELSRKQSLEYAILISKLKLNIIHIIQDIGCCRIQYVVELILDNKLDGLDFTGDHKEYMDILDNHVNPIRCELYTLQEDNSFSLKHTPSVKGIHTTHLSSSTNRLTLYDNQLHEPSLMKLNPFTKGLPLRLNGCKIYIPFGSTLLVMCGYFQQTNVYSYTCYGVSRKKYEIITKHLENTTHIPASFTSGFLEQLTLKDILLYTPKELLDQCTHKHTELKRIRSKNITTLIKEFMSMEIDSQRDVFTALLMDPSHQENIYIAYILFDLLHHENQHNQSSDQIYNSLHWVQQKILNEAKGKAETVTNELLKCTEETVPFEKRILLMKAPKRVKSKALEKLKEINGTKGGESTAKAQQYIEGLLKIPFGVYKQEEMITFIHTFRERFTLLREGALQRGLGPSTDITTISCSEMNQYFTQLQKFLHQKSDDILPSILATYGNKQLQKILVDIGQSKKGNKVDLIGRILQYSTLFSLNSRLQYKWFDENILDYSNFITDINDMGAEWDQYKIDRKAYIQEVSSNLDESVYGMDEAKKEVKRIIGQWINGSGEGYILGFEGPPGTGKTTLAKQGIANCLRDADGRKRPFTFIALGGSTNGSTLDGHNYTYVGSTWGRIADALMEAQCMNPIIYIDELDKISRTEHGKELIGILIHLTDPSQNEEFMDKYFSGIKLDISKCLIIFSYNDVSQVDRVLLDRIHRIKINALNRHDKYQVAMDHLIPEISSKVGFSPGDVTIDQETLFYIIDNYTYEAGARKLKECLFDLIREINMEFIMGDVTSFPQAITIDMVKSVFSHQRSVQIKRIADQPSVGRVNGLYATSAGTGGITIIETFKFLAESRLKLELTGQQGDVMKESMRVSKTVAWNLLPSSIKGSIRKEAAFGLHVHCPEAAQPKDGPSAGAAITIALLSLLSNIPVNNEIAITGEIDLNGNILAIGGLEYKIEGAKNAGVKTVLCPRDNQEDLDKILLKDHHPIGDDLEVITVGTIYEAIDHMLIGSEKSSGLFSKYSHLALSHNDYLLAFKSMCDESHDLVCIVDTTPEFKLLYCSKGFSDRLKWQLTDIYGSSIFQYLEDNFVESFRKALHGTRDGDLDTCIRLRIRVNQMDTDSVGDSDVVVICHPKKIDNIISCTMRVHVT